MPTVAVISPTRGANQSSLDLPGRLEAYSRAPIYARVSGFLKAWYVDIGAPVKAGQLLAEIEAPDLDQQLLQARAALASAEAAETLAAVTAQRWQTMGATNAVAKQTVDEKTGDLTVKQALTKAAQANVDRLVVLADFKRVMAPFDGIVTTRNTDLGALINADFERRPGAVRDLRRQEAQAERQRAAELRPGGDAQHQGRDHRAGVSRQGLSRRRRGLGALRRSGLGHDAHAGRGRQHGRRVDAGRLRQYPHRAAGEHPGPVDSRRAR